MHTSVESHSVQLRAPYDVDGETWTPVVVTDGRNIITAHTFSAGKRAGEAWRVVVDVLTSVAHPSK